MFFIAGRFSGDPASDGLSDLIRRSGQPVLTYYTKAAAGEKEKLSSRPKNAGQRDI
jgi:hypothetical protein